MRMACWIHNATNTHSEYVMLIAFPLQQLLKQNTSMLRYMQIACLVRKTRAELTNSMCAECRILEC